MEHDRRRSVRRNNDDSRRSEAGKGIAALLGGVLVGYLGYKICKEVKKELDLEKEEEKAGDVELESEIGLKTEQVSEFVENPDNVVKTLYDCLRRSPIWQEDEILKDSINPDFGVDSEETIHVRRFNDNGRDMLTLGFEIPKDDIWRISFYITGLNRSCDEFRKITGNRFEIKKILRGYVGVSFQQEGEEDRRLEYIEIPEQIFSKYAFKNSNGLTEYVKKLEKGEIKYEEDEISSYVEKYWEHVRYPRRKDVKFAMTMLMYDIEFPLEMWKGIDMTGALKLLKFCISGLAIELKGGELMKYNYLLFHPRNEFGVVDLTWFYDTARGETIENSFT